MYSISTYIMQTHFLLQNNNNNYYMYDNLLLLMKVYFMCIDLKYVSHILF